jgi:hypothetical protein
MISRQRRSAIATVTILLFATYIAWLYCHGLIYKRTVLKVPIRFEREFSLRHRFTVGPAAQYWVVIGYHKEFRASASNPNPPEEFKTEFSVLLDGNVVAKGGSDSYAPSQRPWSLFRNYVAYYAGGFDAKADKLYELSLRIDDVQPTLIATDGEVRVMVDGNFDRGYPIRNGFIVYGGIGLAIALLIYMLFALLRERNKGLK